MSLYTENSYLLNEALKNIEASIREQIAQEILEWAQKYHDNPIVENCVRIARGQK
jgi:hypothetical protein